MYGHRAPGPAGSTLGIAGFGGFAFLVVWIGEPAATALFVATGIVGIAFLGRGVRNRAGTYRAALGRRARRPRSWDASVRDIADQMEKAFAPGARGQVFGTPGIVVNGSAATIASIVDHRGPELLARVLQSHWTTVIARHGAVLLSGVTPWVTWRVDETLPAHVFRLTPDQTPPASAASRIAA